MIVPMKKIWVLCTAVDREETLLALRELGVLHVLPARPPESEALEKARHRQTYVQRALDVLPRHPHARPSGRSADEIVEEVWALIHRRQDLQEEDENLRHELQRLEPFGDFDPAGVRALAARGVTLRLYHAGPRQELAVPADATLQVLCRDKRGVFFTVAGRGELKLSAQEVRLPAASTSAMRQRREAIAAELGHIGEQMAAHAGDYPAVAATVQQAEEQVRFLEVRACMGAAARVVYVQGFCPQRRVELLRAAAAREGWGLLVEDPAPDDPVPTLLDNPRWVRPIRALFDIIGIIPGYNEVDISACFLLFFSLFFAILVGDAAYGLLFLGLTRLARRKLPTAPSRYFSLMYVMSACTVVWGALTGTWLGMAVTSGPLAWPVLPWLKKDDNVKLLCFAIGVIHLSIAHLWNIIRMRHSLQAVAQLGWLCTTWTMFFFACVMVLNLPFDRYLATVPVLGNPFPKFMVPVFLFGVAAIVLFMTPVKDLKTEWFNHAMLPLNLVSNFVDVVSYIRLFAVGTASFAVADSFNRMLSPMLGHWATALFAALFLFLAHSLNIVLSLMGVMVHGVRLNTLEFSGHVGMQWTGVPYEPFRRGEDAEAARSA